FYFFLVSKPKYNLLSLEEMKIYESISSSKLLSHSGLNICSIFYWREIKKFLLNLL
ncbi:hypothetical protein, partial [Plasmodium yoelii yoelii]